MNLRQYTDQDIDELLQVWWDSWHSSASFRHPLPLAAWRARWENLLLTHEVAVLEGAEGIVGFAAVEPRKKELSQIFVAPNQQGKGHGKMLFAWARGICGDGMKLKTLVENSDARSFYISRGMNEGVYSINDFNGKKEISYSFDGGNGAT